MKQIEPYLKVLEILIQGAHLQVKAHLEKNTLNINDILFKKINRQQLKDHPPHGILLPTLTQDERLFCDTFKISYLTLDGHFQLIQEKSVLRLERFKKPPQAPPYKNMGQPHKQISPTLLVSPYSLSILDTLFRAPESSLKEKSGLAFTKEFDLYQPKLSKIMRDLNAHTLIELKAKIQELPAHWWQLAWQYPATRKGLTPFFEAAKPYHSLNPLSLDQQALKNLLLKYHYEIIPGPPEVAKDYGVIIDADSYYWGTEKATQDLKAELRLVPGKAPLGPTWHLAIGSKDLKTEAILSRMTNLRSNTLQGTELANTFRAIWDLSFGSERLQAVRINILRKVIK